MKKYAVQVVDEINNKYDIDNIEIETLLLKIYKYIDTNKRLKMYDELYTKYTKNNINIEALYIIARGISISDELEILKKYLNKILEEIDIQGLNENNIQIFEGIIYIFLESIEDEEVVRCKENECYEYYKTKYGENSDNVIALLRNEAQELINLIRPLADKYLDKNDDLYRLILEKEEVIKSMASK